MESVLGKCCQKAIKMARIYCVDGNIGSGKSTVLRELSSRGCTVVEEDVASWQPYLTKFYSDPTRWSFTLQMEILQSLISTQFKGERVFVERDPFACNIFTLNAVKMGFMTNLEYDLFCKCKDLMTSWTPTLRFVLTVPVTECLKRVQNRNRSGEKNGVTIDYLSELEVVYTKQLLTQSNIVKLDGTLSPQHIADEILSKLKQINC